MCYMKVSYIYINPHNNHIKLGYCSPHISDKETKLRFRKLSNVP